MTTQPAQTTKLKDGFNSSNLQKLADEIHWPRCWDTAAYPNFWDAVYEIVSCAGCSEHPPKPEFPHD